MALTLAQVLALLPDNITGDISAADMRTAITEAWNRTDGTSPIEGLQLDVAATPPAVHTAGHLGWDAANATLAVMSDIDGVTLQVGQESWLVGRNATGVTIPNGTPVRIVGAVGQRPSIAPDNGQGDIVGLATHDIPNNSNGKVTVHGLVRDVDTSAFVAGDHLHVTAAGVLSTAVSASAAGFVLNAHASQGVILSKPDSLDQEDGTTANRPVTVSVGFMYFDTTLGLPIWWDGAAWVDATGTPV